MTATRLPAALAPWAEPLAVLDPQFALALGPLVRQLDQLLARQGTAAGFVGEMDGFGGLSRRGDPSRLVMSEWSLAQDVPLEFLRRAASQELLYLAPHVVEDRSRGRVAVLVDSGPDQLGPGRLVQLAVLIVASRRAARRGGDLVVGILGDEPGAWRTGDLKVVLRGWLRSRRTEPVDAVEIERWTAGLDAKDEVWTLTGRRLAEQAAGRRRMIVSSECAWGPDGATAVEVLLDGDRLELALPHGDVAVRALRGAAFRVDDGSGLTESAGIRHPCFPGASPWLLGRGQDATELIAVQVPSDGRRTGRPKRHRFAGPVLTGAFVGRRLVALVLVEDELRVIVRGKRLGRVDQIAVPSYAVDLDGVAIDAITERALVPMVFAAGDMLVQLPGQWWRLVPGAEPQQALVHAVLPSDRPDVPRVAWVSSDQIWAPPTAVPSGVARIVLGPGALIAWPEGDDRWHVAPGGRSVIVPDAESVLGLAIVEDAPALVTLSTAGLIVRLRWPAGERTLTAWSGGVESPTLHPTRPWLAVRRDDGRVEVADLERNALLLTVPSAV